MVDRIALNVTAASDRVSSIAVNGAEVASGEWSAPVPLHFGTTSISVVVVAGRYGVENAYTVRGVSTRGVSEPRKSRRRGRDVPQTRGAEPQWRAEARVAVRVARRRRARRRRTRVPSRVRRSVRIGGCGEQRARRRTGVRTGDRSVDPHAAASGARRRRERGCEWREDGASVRRRVGVVGGRRGVLGRRVGALAAVRLNDGATSPVSTTIGPSTSSTWTIERRACL